MSTLAFDKQGKPFTFARSTRKLLVRFFPNPGGRGTCVAVLDGDGEQIYLDADANYLELRRAVGNEPGLYRLDQCDADGNEIDDVPAAYVSSVRHATPRGQATRSTRSRTPMSGHEVAGGPMTARTTLARDQEVCTTADIDAVRYEVARADVLADAAMQAFDVTIWREVDAARIDYVAHLVSAASEAASAALLAVDDLRRAMASRRAVPSGEIWTE